jgi:2-dehydropantoate 2-reductase
MRVKSAIEGESVVKAAAVERLDGQPAADLVLFCVKSFDTASAAEAIRPVVGPDTGVLSVQNGVDNEDTLARALGPGHVVGGVAQVFATIEAPGVIAHTLLGRILCGEMDGKDSGRVRAFLAACERAGIPAERSADIVRTLWEKYVYLVAHASMTALTRCPAGVLRAIPEARAMYRRIIDEMVALARAERVALAPDCAEQCMGNLDAVGANALSSLHHDLVHGKRLEVEALQGHAVRLGTRHGVPTPTLADVYALLRPHRDGASGGGAPRR